MSFGGEAGYMTVNSILRRSRLDFQLLARPTYKEQVYNYFVTEEEN
jgi:hypothetical protein